MNRWRWLPSAISAVRATLGLPVAAALWFDRPTLAAGLFFFGVLTDALDGLLARWLGVTSAGGSIADSVADRAFLLPIVVVLWARDFLLPLEQAVLALRIAGEVAFGFVVWARQRRFYLRSTEHPLLVRIGGLLIYTALGGILLDGPWRGPMAWLVVLTMTAALLAATRRQWRKNPPPVDAAATISRVGQ